MKRYLLVGAFVMAFATPALAEQFYVALIQQAINAR
jgi:hypothetical protein